jgi:hypothetical protein
MRKVAAWQLLHAPEVGGVTIADSPFALRTRVSELIQSIAVAPGIQKLPFAPEHEL